jgi:uncharacterized protein
MKINSRWWLVALPCIGCAHAVAQVPPSSLELTRYQAYFAAAASGDVAQIRQFAADKADPNARDDYERTALHVAAYRRQPDAMRALVAAGADANAMDRDHYDIVTIAAVADDVPTLKAALDIGGSAKNITSPYAGTALIAAAHLGHDEVVRVLIAAGAPLDHVNNLGWTAVIESIVLGDGGPRHVATLKALLDAGASVDITDRQGDRPLALARRRGYTAMVTLIETSKQPAPR